MPKAKPANKQINVPKDAEVLHLQHVICAEGSSEWGSWAWVFTTGAGRDTPAEFLEFRICKPCAIFIMTAYVCSVYHQSPCEAHSSRKPQVELSHSVIFTPRVWCLFCADIVFWFLELYLLIFFFFKVNSRANKRYLAYVMQKWDDTSCPSVLIWLGKKTQVGSLALWYQCNRERGNERKRERE